MAAAASDGFLDIGSVAREIGVSPSTLRSWERRYRIVVPRRSDSGQRLYDAEQIRVLRLIRAQIGEGVRAGAAHRAIETRAPLLSRRLELPPGESAPRLARQAADAVASSAGDERFGFMLRLVASELVNNAVLHGGSKERIGLEVELFEGWVHVRVVNAGTRLTLKSLRRRRRSDSGRGLDIVDALADEWTIDSCSATTTIEARLRVAGR
jgi:DNA-binding transcriptional MerR regulator